MGVSFRVMFFGKLNFGGGNALTEAIVVENRSFSGENRQILTVGDTSVCQFPSDVQLLVQQIVLLLSHLHTDKYRILVSENKK